MNSKKLRRTSEWVANIEVLSAEISHRAHIQNVDKVFIRYLTVGFRGFNVASTSQV